MARLRGRGQCADGRRFQFEIPLAGGAVAIRADGVEEKRALTLVIAAGAAAAGARILERDPGEDAESESSNEQSGGAEVHLENFEYPLSNRECPMMKEGMMGARS